MKMMFIPAIVALLSCSALAKPSAFGFAPPSESFVYAPYGVESVMAMAALGAKGTTEKEILHVFPDLAKKNALVSQTEGTDFRLSIANSAWIKKSFSLLPAYSSALTSKFGATITPLEFKDPVADAAQMKAWVEKNTQGKIKKLIEASAIDDSIRLVLVNTLYFKAKWESPFKSESTLADDFHPEKGKAFKADFMNQTHSYSVIRRKNYDTVILPYSGRHQTLWLTLPHPGTTLEKIEANYEENALEKSYATDRNASKATSVQLSLPKFSISSNLSLVPYLQKRGVETLFDAGSADLSGISAEKPLYVTGIIQKAVIDLDEEGTEAAAATAMTLGGMAATFRETPPLPLIFDRPFAYLLRDEMSGKILFMGRMARPPEAKNRK
jgi:serpin B